MNLQKLRDQAKQFSYNSLLDLAPAEAKSAHPRTAKRQFLESGDFDEFYRRFQAYFPKPEPAPEPNGRRMSKKKQKRDKREPILVDANNEACNTARDIYFEEFESLRNDTTLKAKIIIMNETIVPVDFSEFYRRMKVKAPCLLALMETLYPEQYEELENEAEESNHALLPTSRAHVSIPI